VMVQMDYEPEGMKESVGSGLGMDSRRVRGDLESFKQFIESVGTETGSLARGRRELGTARAGDVMRRRLLLVSPARCIGRRRNESFGENALELQSLGWNGALAAACSAFCTSHQGAGRMGAFLAGYLPPGSPRCGCRGGESRPAGGVGGWARLGK
jgi:hypothetical protein